MTYNTRDQDICADYKRGMELKELERTYGISDRRISQILGANGVPLRPRGGGTGRKPISKLHVRIGLLVAERRFDHDLTIEAAADELGWSVIKLRNVERGIKELELLDLVDIASYTKTPISELVEGAAHG